MYPKVRHLTQTSNCQFALWIWHLPIWPTWKNNSAMNSYVERTTYGCPYVKNQPQVSTQTAHSQPKSNNMICVGWYSSNKSNHFNQLCKMIHGMSLINVFFTMHWQVLPWMPTGFNNVTKQNIGQTKLYRTCFYKFYVELLNQSTLLLWVIKS